MRKQVRPECPALLARHGARWNRQWKELRSVRTDAAFSWYRAEGVSAREAVLPVLREMNQGHCSFCDAFPLEDRTTEPVEHFRPKSDLRFCDQAYTWENLYYCCPQCQRRKGDQWDDLLLRPDDADYAFARYFFFDYTTGQISPTPRPAGDAAQAARITIRMYGLDEEARRRCRRLELRRWLRSTDRRVDEWAYRDFLEGGDGVGANEG